MCYCCFYIFIVFISPQTTIFSSLKIHFSCSTHFFFFLSKQQIDKFFLSRFIYLSHSVCFYTTYLSGIPLFILLTTTVCCTFFNTRVHLHLILSRHVKTSIAIYDSRTLIISPFRIIYLFLIVIFIRFTVQKKI